MIYENQEPSWKVVNNSTINDNFVKFAFECNECTTHDNVEETINEIKSVISEENWIKI